MSKKTKKITREVFEEETFFDRDVARQEFWNRHRMVNEGGNFQILMFYGIGGMGKTSLLHQIEKEINTSESDTIWEYYDFNDGQDPVVVLKKIASDLQQKHKFKFPVFSYAVYSYYLKCGEDANAPEVNNILDSIPLLREAFRLANVIPGVSTFSQPAEWIADKICDSVDLLKKNKSKDIIEKINNATKEKLHNEISAVFLQELNENLDKRNRPILVLLFDTYERLVNELSTIGTPIENDLWLRDDNDGILQQIDKLLCVFAGRECLKWSEMDPDWDDEVLTQIEVDTLDKENSIYLLNRYDVTDVTIQKKIYEVTKGMPLYLDICIDTCKSVKERGDEVREDLFDNKIEKMAQRFMTYMSDDEKDVLYLLSCIGRWKDDEFYEINELLEAKHNAVKESVYNKVLSLTFVRKDTDGYFIHQTMQEILVKYCNKDKILSFLSAMREYVENENKLTSKYFRYAYLISKICGIKKTNEINKWWTEYIYEVLKVYLDGFFLRNFIDIYEVLPQDSNDYRLNTLYLSYLLKKGNYDTAFKYIEKYMPKDENDKDALEFFLTASYYYYINGKDEEALRLRKIVFDKRKQVLGEDDIETVRAGLALAASFSRVGDHKKSIELGNVCREKLNENREAYDSTISAARNQLGDSYFRIGKYEKAMSIYKEVYEDRKHWLGEKNNSTMIAYNHIADCLVNLGKYADALSIYSEVKKIREKEFSKDKKYEYCVDGEKKISSDHPDTIIVDNNRAVCFIYMKKYEDARSILKEVVAKRKATLADSAPATMGALENLAMCEFYCGLLDTAVSHINEVIRVLAERFPETHYDLIIARYHKALIEGDAEMISMIMEKYNEPLAINPSYLEYMKKGKCIGYFSLGRYYE